MENLVTRTITVDTGEDLRGFVEKLVESGSYKTNSEVVREGLRLLQEKQAHSKLRHLKLLIEEGDSSGEAMVWNKRDFFKNVDANISKLNS